MGVIITANAGHNQKVKEGKQVTLHGAGSDSGTSSSGSKTDDDQLNFLWNQIAGKPVNLRHIDTHNAKFKAPHVKKTGYLGFQLIVYVYDGNGNSSSDTVKIIVRSHKDTHSHNHEH